MIEITKTLSIPGNELSYTFSRSAKPGGQHVNKVSTRATLHFDVAGSASLSEEQRERILERLQTRINREGVMRVVSQKHRSQRANREEATRRFVELLRETLRKRAPRRKTRVPKAVVERRLEEKQRQSLRKKERSKKFESEE